MTSSWKKRELHLVFYVEFNEFIDFNDYEWLQRLQRLQMTSIDCMHSVTSRTAMNASNFKETSMQINQNDFTLFGCKVLIAEDHCSSHDFKMNNDVFFLKSQLKLLIWNISTTIFGMTSRKAFHKDCILLQLSWSIDILQTSLMRIFSFTLSLH